jgi:hypothetical protein
MGTIANAINTAYRDYVVDGVPASGANNPSKSECRAVGPAIETWLANPVMDNYGVKTVVKGRRANGASGSPTAIASGDTLVTYQGAGWYVTGGPAFNSYGAEMRAEATENYTSTAQGSRWVWQVTPNTTATPADAMWLEQDASLRVKGGLGMKAGVGAGSTVTQGTSRTTAVSINALSGAITMFTAAGSTTWATFTVNNSKVEINDVVIPSVRSSTNKYRAHVTAVANGSFDISFASTTGTSSDAPVINFVVIKGSVN